MIMNWEEYLREELKYYDEHPDEDNDPTECHSNGVVCTEVEYK